MKARIMSLSHALHARHGLSPLRLWAATWRAVRLHCSRQRLSALEPHLLRDIGLTPEQARQEASRPIWDAPDLWKMRD